MRKHGRLWEVRTRPMALLRAKTEDVASGYEAELAVRPGRSWRITGPAEGSRATAGWNHGDELFRLGAMISVVVPCRPSTIEETRRTFPVPEGADEIIFQPGPDGAWQGRNRGAVQARGNILVFLDDDVEVIGNLQSLDSKTTDYWVAKFLDVSGDPWSSIVYGFLNVGVDLSYPQAACGGFQAVRRGAFEAIRGYRDVPQEDVDLFERLAARGFKRGLFDGAVLVHRAMRPYRAKEWQLRGP